MKNIAFFASLASILLLSGCGLAMDAPPTPMLRPSQVAEAAVSPPQAARFQARLVNLSRCVYPAGWQALTVGLDDTLMAIAARYGVTTEALRTANCLTDEVVTGQRLYVPARQYGTGGPQTVLPLSITGLTAEPALVSPGETIRVQWTTQGALREVHLGRVVNGQYVGIASGLPAVGELDIIAPADGRDRVELVLLVRDGLGEVQARTRARVRCSESWFFDPAPGGCPTPVLQTVFEEQHFEHGALVHVPALDTHYLLVRGQEAVALPDEYMPGVSSLENADSPFLTAVAIHYVWSRDEVRAVLGLPIGPPRRYMGQLQRELGSQEELVYLSAASGHVYRFGNGVVWGVIVPE